MKYFRKIGSVLASAAMLTSTVALAAAANFPGPYVANGAADVAIVYVPEQELVPEQKLSPATVIEVLLTPILSLPLQLKLTVPPKLNVVSAAGVRETVGSTISL